MIRLTSILHGYPPDHNAGAEQYMHQVHRWLMSRGHQVLVLLRNPPSAGDYEGVPTGWVRDEVPLENSIYLTHLDQTRLAMQLSFRDRRPLVHVLHNDRQLTANRVNRAALIVANSDWIRASIPSALGKIPSLTVYPPTFLADHSTDGRERECLTLINLTKAKGARLFYQLASAMSDYQFLGVTGGYGVQLPAPRLPNLQIVANRPHLRPVWDETRIYLQPSAYESFGKAAMEAMASAIPVIAHPTRGLKESLGPAGMFCARDDPNDWQRTIEALDDPDRYAAASQNALTRARVIEEKTLIQLEALEAALLGLM